MDGKKSCLKIYLTAILVTSNFALYWTIAYWDKAWRQPEVSTECWSDKDEVHRLH